MGEITDRDLRIADQALAFAAGVCSMGVAMLVILVFAWRPLIC
jgi:hypothetical protein